MEKRNEATTESKYRMSICIAGYKIVTCITLPDRWSFVRFPSAISLCRVHGSGHVHRQKRERGHKRGVKHGPSITRIMPPTVNRNRYDHVLVEKRNERMEIRLSVSRPYPPFFLLAIAFSVCLLVPHLSRSRKRILVAIAAQRPVAEINSSYTLEHATFRTFGYLVLSDRSHRVKAKRSIIVWRSRARSYSWICGIAIATAGAWISV